MKQHHARFLPNHREPALVVNPSEEVQTIAAPAKQYCCPRSELSALSWTLVEAAGMCVSVIDLQ